MKKLLAAATVLAVSTAQADTIYVDVSCPGPGKGSEAEPYCSIQTAIDNAVNTDEIVVAPGTYLEAIDFLGKAITLRGTDGPDVTIIDGTGFFHVVQCVSGEGSGTVLDGFTITGGNADGDLPPDFYGGGMLNEGSSPTVTNCTFVNNTAMSCPKNDVVCDGRGGAMYNHESFVTVTDCTFAGNVGSEGGGMYNWDGGPTVIDCTFEENAAVSPFDGSDVGGGMYNLHGNVVVIGCTFTGNTASDGGGGLRNTFGNVTVLGCTFTGNVTGAFGGAMYIVGASATVIDSVFNGNSTGVGGGLRNTGGTVTVIGCTFAGNTALEEGGGMSNGSNSSLAVMNSTLTENSSPNGRAIGLDGAGTFSMVNSILWNGGNEVWANGEPTVTVIYTDVQGGFPGNGNIDADPFFVDPDNGDLRLQPGSPCIDAADNTAVPSGITVDLNGNPRFIDDPDTPDCPQAPGQCGDPPVVDMGAYEFQLCPWDCGLGPDGIDTVGIVDFLTLLAQWGGPGSCDIDGDGIIGILDFLLLLANWGPCP